MKIQKSSEKTSPSYSLFIATDTYKKGTQEQRVHFGFASKEVVDSDFYIRQN